MCIFHAIGHNTAPRKKYRANLIFVRLASLRPVSQRVSTSVSALRAPRMALEDKIGSNY